MNAESVQANNATNSILKELSDIKSNLAVNANETTNIRNSLGEMRVDIKEIKSDFVSRRESNEAFKEIKDTIVAIKKTEEAQDLVIDGLKSKINIWAGAFAVITFIVPFIIHYFIK